MLSSGDTLTSGAIVGTEMPGLTCLGRTFSGRRDGRPVLILGLTLPARYSSKFNDRDAALPGVLRFTGTLEKNNLWVMTFDVDPERFRGVDGWPQPKLKKLQPREFLFQLGAMISEQENSPGGVGGKFFNPYFAPGTIVLDEHDKAHLLGVSFDFGAGGSFELPADLARYVHPGYIAARQSPRTRIVPEENDPQRLSYMRYGFGLMVWELATGETKTPLQGDAHGNGDTFDLTTLAPEWASCGKLIELCLDPKANWPAGTSLRSLCEQAFAPPPSPPQPEPYRVPDAIPAPDYQPPEPVIRDFDPVDVASEDPPERAISRARPGLIVATLIGGLLLGVACGVVYMYFWPAVLTNAERKNAELSGQIEVLEEDLRTEQRRSLLLQWLSADASTRKRIDSWMTINDPNNLNLRYFRIVGEMNAARPPSDWFERVATLSRDLASIDSNKNQKGFPRDPSCPSFDKDDLESLVLMAQNLK